MNKDLHKNCMSDNYIIQHVLSVLHIFGYVFQDYMLHHLPRDPDKADWR